MNACLGLIFAVILAAAYVYCQKKKLRTLKERKVEDKPKSILLKSKVRSTDPDLEFSSKIRLNTIEGLYCMNAAINNSSGDSVRQKVP